MPEVSVIIPTYNYGTFVIQAVQSVLNQTFSDLEVIVVDDGSTDDTVERIHSITDPRLHYIYQRNSGLPASRNTGIRSAKGKYIAFLDADDCWMPNKLEIQLPILQEDESIGLVYGSYYVIDTEGKIIALRRASELPRNALPRLIMGNLVSGSATTSIIRRECVDRVGLFKEDLISCEDWDMWLRIAEVYNFGYVKEPVAMIRLHDRNMTNRAETMEMAALIVLERFFSRSNSLKLTKLMYWRAKSAVYLQSSVFHRRNFKYHLAIKSLARSIYHYPFWLDPYILSFRLFYQLARILISNSKNSK